MFREKAMGHTEKGYLIQFAGAMVFLLGFGALRYGLVGLVIGIGLMTAGSWLWGRGRKIRNPNRKPGKTRSFRLTR
jgi:hypothetical protein